MRQFDDRAMIAAELPAVRASANKLQQVFLNLCKNAMEAMAQRGELLRICARVSEGGGVEVQICDEGKGIAADVDVFAPFVTTKHSGMGLGLALVRDIVEAHGGEIGYRSEVDVGTTFTIQLPSC